MIYVFICIVLITVFACVLPLINKSQSGFLFEQVQDPIATLEEKKEGLLESIRELDFDYETEKISTKDYQSLRKKIEKQTVQVLKGLETAKAQWQELESSL